MNALSALLLEVSDYRREQKRCNLAHMDRISLVCCFKECVPLSRAAKARHFLNLQGNTSVFVCAQGSACRVDTLLMQGITTASKLPSLESAAPEHTCAWDLEFKAPEEQSSQAPPIPSWLSSSSCWSPQFSFHVHCHLLFLFVSSLPFASNFELSRCLPVITTT